MSSEKTPYQLIDPHTQHPDGHSHEAHKEEENSNHSKRTAETGHKHEHNHVDHKEKAYRKGQICILESDLEF